MNWAILENNVIVNRIVADESFINEFYPGAICVDDIDPQPQIGWKLSRGKWIAPEPVYENISE